MVEQWTENPRVGGSIPPLDNLYYKNKIMNNSIIKFLITIKNASLAKKEFVDIKPIKNTIKLIELLYNEGLLQSYDYNFKKKTVRIHFRFFNGNSTLKNLKIYSSPSKILYFSLKDIYKIDHNHKLFIFLTIQGFKSALECKKYKMGGTACFCF